MKTQKIYYSTAYAQYENINGYVIAIDAGDKFIINNRQYNRAIRNLTIGNVAPVFHCEKIVEIID